MNSFDISLQRFPQSNPFVDYINDDPVFDPARHLALTEPENLLSLSELGYGEEIDGTSPTDIAATSAFRILSEEGTELMLHVCQQLEAFTSSNARIAKNCRGGTYRSKFLRDFSLSQDVAEHLSSIMKTQLVPHAMGHQLSHLNYAPPELSEDVDKWHYDTLQVDYVMFVTDPKKISGGEFQYFLGTRDEMQALYEAKETLPAERVVAPEIPGPGYAVLMQGNYVVHQAKGLKEKGERITLVNGYNYADKNTPDYTAFKQLILADPESLATAEYIRHVALRCAGNLEEVINQPHFETDKSVQLQKLYEARRELEIGIAQLEDDNVEEMKHFGN